MAEASRVRGELARAGILSPGGIDCTPPYEGLRVPRQIIGWMPVRCPSNVPDALILSTGAPEYEGRRRPLTSENQEALLTILAEAA